MYKQWDETEKYLAYFYPHFLPEVQVKISRKTTQHNLVIKIKYYDY